MDVDLSDLANMIAEDEGEITLNEGDWHVVPQSRKLGSYAYAGQVVIIEYDGIHVVWRWAGQRRHYKSREKAFREMLQMGTRAER